MSVSALRRKSRFFNRENLDFLLNADTLRESQKDTQKVRASKSKTGRGTQRDREQERQRDRDTESKIEQNRETRRDEEKHRDKESENVKENMR